MSLKFIIFRKIFLNQKFLTMKIFLLSLSLFLFCSTFTQAQDLFLEVDKEIKGGSLSNNCRDCFDILSFEFGASQSGTMHMGSGGGAGKAQFGDITIMAYSVPGDVAFLNLLATGDHKDKMTLKLFKSGNNSTPYLEYVLTNVMITSYSQGFAYGDEKPMSTYTLNFAEIDVKHIPQNNDGNLDTKTAKEFKWNIPENKPK